MKDLVIYGAGGQGRELLEIIEEINRESAEWNILGFIDDKLPSGGEVCGYPLLGGFDFFIRCRQPVGVVLGFADCAAKEAAYEKIKASGEHAYFPVIVHPYSYVSARAFLAEGAAVARFCSVNVNARIGKCVVVNNKCEIAHDSTVGDFASLMPSVNISGNVTIGKRTFIGVQAAVLQGVTIGSDSIVGMCSTVLTDIPDECTAVGSPAKIIARRAKGGNGV